MKKEVTIVTAFIDIGRKEFKSIPRSNEKYLEHFKYWARIKNNIIVYTNSDISKDIIKIRSDFGLADKTKIVEINDIESIEPEILKKMEQVEESKYFRDYRYIKNPTENKAIYNYIMLLKPYFVADAVKRNLTKDTVAWLDFGYNHGGKCYKYPEEFDFLWEYDFEDKIYLFEKNEDIGLPIFKIIQSMEVNFSGGMQVIPSHLADEFWQLMKKQMEDLLKLGLMDDDQLLLLMAYREKKEIFKVVKENWFEGIKLVGGNHLTYNKSIPKQTLKDKILYKYRVNKRNRMYLKRFKNSFLKDYLD